MKLKYVTLALYMLIAFGCKGTSDSGTDAQSGGGATKGQSSAPRASGVTEADLGVPFYPGSTPDDSVGGDAKEVGTAHTTVGSNHVSSDSADKVLAFYKEKLPKFESSKAGGADLMTGKGSNGGEVAISITKDGDHSKIIIVNTL